MNSDLSRRLSALSPKRREFLERLRAEGQRDNHEKPIISGTRVQVSTGFKMNFGLMFFAADATTNRLDKYESLLTVAKCADELGFIAVWVPERHFQDFGGLFPNPSVIGSALAMVTTNVQIRAGSVVAPLHHAIRIAEEWSVVDNLSHGRVGLSFATGWNKGDFVLCPTNYQSRRKVMVEQIAMVKQLWSHGVGNMAGVDREEVTVRLTPRPIQHELPIWVTSSGNIETWELAGELGANILGAMILQNFDDLAARIRVYRKARERAGFDPAAGIVTIMLHTFVGENEDEVKEKVRLPLYNYLSQFLSQQEEQLRQAADQDGHPLARSLIDSKDELLAFAFERYFRLGSLLGTPDKCFGVVRQLSAIGVNEIACLVDFGMETHEVVSSLRLVSDFAGRGE